MALPTYDITITVSDSAGTPVVGASVIAVLDRTEIDNVSGSSYVVPAKITAETGSTGATTLALWPNTRGSTESQYRFIARNPDNGNTYFDIMGTVPEYNSTLVEIAQIPPYPGMSDGQAAVDTAVRAAAEAKAALSKLDNFYQSTEAPLDGSTKLTVGDLWYDTDDDQLFVYRGSIPASEAYCRNRVNGAKIPTITDETSCTTAGHYWTTADWRPLALAGYVEEGTATTSTFTYADTDNEILNGGVW
jgi:gamma-glutamylcyclotransferase (GGCT)/AIG2-like uncharacterized protein YtfP